MSQPLCPLTDDEAAETAAATGFFRKAAGTAAATFPWDHPVKLFAALLSCIFSIASFAENLKVAAAISLRESLTKAAEQFRKDNGTQVEFTFGSSGQLAAQISGGAPVDLFVSAASKQVDDLIKADAVIADSIRIIATNTLVMIAPADAVNPPDSISALASDSVKKVAIGEPRTVPAGQYAMQAMEHAGIANSIRGKLVYGTNVRQVLDYVERGEVSAGLVYATDARQSGDKIKVTVKIGGEAHELIVYPSVIVKASKRQVEARLFAEFLASEKGVAILKEFGFAAGK